MFSWQLVMNFKSNWSVFLCDSGITKVLTAVKTQNCPSRKDWKLALKQKSLNNSLGTCAF